MNSLPQTLLESLQSLHQIRPDCERLLVAFSGGLDSRVLLHACHALVQQSGTLREAGLPGYRLRALHVNHGLSEQSGQWQTYCEQICREAGIRLQTRRVRIDRESGQSLEEAARAARYRVFGDMLRRRETLLLAHHLDDQAETVLLRLLRGAGSRGLSGMPRGRALAVGWLWRPLLGCGRRELREYAEAEGLDWVEDDSNRDPAFDRNYLRHHVAPHLGRRWPVWQQRLAHSAALSRETEQLAVELAEQDLARLATAHAEVLFRAPLQALSEHRQRNLLRLWLQRLAAPEPGARILDRITGELLSGRGAHRRVEWRGWQVHVWRDHLQAFTALAPAGKQPEQWIVSGYGDTIELPGSGRLRLLPCERGGLRLPPDGRFGIRLREPGEACRLSGRRSRPLKKILQDSDVPPWLRRRLPLVLIDDRPAWVPGAGVCEGFAAADGEAGWRVVWELRHWRI